MTYNEIKDVTLIGPNLWNTNATLERVGKFIKNPIFLDSVLTADSDFQASSFFKEYVATFGETPEEFDVVAFDTGLLLRRALESGASTRPELHSKLLSLGRIPGAFGEMSIMQNREVARPVTLLTIKDGRIQKSEDSVRP